MSSWQLFIRHAHRPTFDRDLDNGLSEKGQEQGRRLVKFLKKEGRLDKIAGLCSSPRLRCVETAEFVAEATGLELVIDEQLDERGQSESDRDFQKRVRTFAERALDMKRVCFFSHGDIETDGKKDVKLHSSTIQTVQTKFVFILRRCMALLDL
jgi:broad specificity phosphatase PhoE